MVPNLQGTLILVIDDDRDTRELYRLVLESASYAVEEAATLEEAIRVAETRRPDIVLTDWLLPDGDGFVLSRRLRALASTRETPMLAVTGVCMTRDEQEAAHHAGYSRILEKPVTPSAIVDGIRELLQPAPMTPHARHIEG